jgi:hypothetical protein
LEKSPDGLTELFEFVRVQFHMGLEEFGDLTPDIFWGLWKQRQNNFKRDQYVAGIVASTIAASVGTKDLQATDFVDKTAEDAMYEFKVSRLVELRDAIYDSAPYMLDKARKDALEELLDEGIPNAAQIVSDAFDV